MMHKLKSRSFGVWVWVGFLFTGMAFAQEQTVDLRWAIDWWQTAICLPDDDHKSLVGKEGQLLYHFPGKFEGRGLGFKTVVWFDRNTNTQWEKQELYSPKVPLVRTWKSSGDIGILEEAFASVRTYEQPSNQPAQPAARDDIVIVTLKNKGDTPRTIHPTLTIQSEYAISFDAASGVVDIGNSARFYSSDRINETASERDKLVLHLEPVVLTPGQEYAYAVRFQNGVLNDAQPITLEEALAQKDEAIEFWNSLDLPYDKIRVPDAGIQHQLVSALRNIYQARVMKDGLPAYQVGPTLYRGLWVVDGAFLLETAAMLGEVEDARNGIGYLMSFQRENGSFEKIGLHWKESGIVLWACCRHARLTQDKDWLLSVWPKLERAVGAIKAFREQASVDPEALNFGLIPPGFPDGGLGRGDRFEYTNIYWNLGGLKAAIEAAHWLGKEELAGEWQVEYDDFLAAFTKAANRDLTDDGDGNLYVPTIMANIDNELPQRAQWAFCHAVYPGRIFASDDPLVIGTLNMLKATKQEDMVYGTGWKADGLWNYFASFYGHAWLWLGDGDEAIESLYSFANHASPTLCWREEQNVEGELYDRIGDMPHNWASAEFIRLTESLLAIERGNELHLLEGMPAEWAKPGMVTQLNGVLTRFGPLDMELTISGDGRKAKLKVGRLPAEELEKIVVHLAGWAPGAKGTTIEFSGRRKISKTLKLQP